MIKQIVGNSIILHSGETITVKIESSSVTEVEEVLNLISLEALIMFCEANQQFKLEQTMERFIEKYSVKTEKGISLIFDDMLKNIKEKKMYDSELAEAKPALKEVDCIEAIETEEILSVKHFRKAGIWMQHNNYDREIVKILFAIFRHKTGLSKVTFVPKSKESKELVAEIFKSLVASPEKDYNIIISADDNRHVRKNRYFNQRLIDERYFEVLGENIIFKKEYVDFINSEEFREMDERLCDEDGSEFTTRQHKDICIQYNLELIELLKKNNLLK